MQLGIGMGLARHGGVWLAGGGVTYEWLMRDEFVATRLADEINGTAAEPSSDYSRYVVDSTDKMTIAGEKLGVSGGISTFGDPMIQWQPGFARTIGLCLIFRAPLTSTVRFGWGKTINANPQEMAFYPSFPSQVYDNSDIGAITVDAPTGATAYAIVQRSKGAHYFYLDAQNRWVRLFVGFTSVQNTLYPGLTTYNAAVGQLDHVRVAQLSAPWTSDFGAAVDYLASAAANATTTMTADGWVECTWVAANGATLDVEVRRSDDDNAWIVRFAQTGTVKIIEKSAGVETERASTNVAFSAGSTRRLLINCNGTTITPYIFNTPVVKANSYASAFNQSATGVKVSSSVTNLATWRRYETLLPVALVALESVPSGLEYTAELSTFKVTATAGGNMAVVYVGASITDGSSASNPATESFRAVIGSYLDTTYPNTTFTHVNAGIGGTRSWYALTRLATDVVAHNPALVFVDTCNDNASERDRASGEALVRLIRDQLPAAAIISNLFQGYANYLTNNLTPNAEDARRWQRRVMNHYHVPFHDWTLTLTAEVANGNDMTDYLADMTHPNTAGHALIAQKCIEILEAAPNGTPVDWTNDLTSIARLDPATADYENTPIVRNGTDNDGEAGTWTTQFTIARQSTVADSTISWVGTLRSFGLDSNYGVGAGVVAWSVDGGAYTNLDLSTKAVANMEITSFGTRSARTIMFKVISGTVRINRFLAI